MRRLSGCLSSPPAGCVRAVSPVGAQTLQLGAATFLAEIERLDAFRRLVERYLLALFAQISQLAACNRLHATEQRLSRWLLMTHDRVATDTFPVGEGPSLSLPNCCFRRRGAPRRRSRYSDDVAEDLSGTV